MKHYGLAFRGKSTLRFIFSKVKRSTNCPIWLLVRSLAGVQLRDVF